MNSITITILVLLAIVVLFAARRWAALGMLTGVLYLTQGETVNVFGLNLFPMRFLEVVGFLRVTIRRDFSFTNMIRLDKAFLCLYIYSTLVFLLRSTEGQLFQIGVAVDAALCYFTFRGLIREMEELRTFLRATVVLLVPYVALVGIEMLTSRNPFSLVGAISDVALFRDGRPRCVGSFRHPVLMGTLGTSFLPLYIGLAFSKDARIVALTGASLCMGLVLLANSGGPTNSAAIVLIGWLCWLMRTKMHLVRRCLATLFVIFCVAMNAPVWYLFAKVSTITGGDGWHRSYLLDVAVRNLGKWWVAGMPIVETQDWFPYYLAVSGGADITNQFLAFGITAGLGAVSLSVWVLVVSFKSLGKALSAIRSFMPAERVNEPILWGLGVALSMHIVNWFGVCYFDQSYVIWFLQLALISNFSQVYGNSYRPSIGEADFVNALDSSESPGGQSVSLAEPQGGDLHAHRGPTSHSPHAACPIIH